MTLEMAFNIAMTLLMGLFGFLFKYLFAELKDLRNGLQAIRTEYQRRDDAQRNNDQLLDLLKDVKRSVEHIDQKLDRKAGNDSNLLIVFYVQIMPDDFVMQLHRF